MRSDANRLQDILETLEQIEKYAQRGRDAFEADELIQNWMIRHLQILGEAAYKVSPQFQAEHPTIPWRQMIGMRHILVHDYFDINLDIVWRVVAEECPRIKADIQCLLKSI